ncbi:RICIN domain-containing protein [Embleya sp. NPDC008237]|uniref:RICIN domain-containing protein n=1 Tax=Embleya sp. NPDC008237 TaxID=3363978 RepID=UPI0036E767E0
MTTIPHRNRRRARRPLRALGAALIAVIAMLSTALPASASPNPTDDGWICDGYYTIGTSNGMVFDISLGPDNAGSVLQYRYWGGYNQQWRVCHWPGDTAQYIFKSRHNGKCLTLWSQDEGAWVTEGDCNGWIYGNQIFWLSRDAATGKVALQAEHSDMWLTTEAGKYTVERSHIVQSATRAGAFTLNPV